MENIKKSDWITVQTITSHFTFIGVHQHIIKITTLKKVLLSIAFFYCSFICFSQIITGTTHDEAGKIFPSVTIALVNSKDSVVVKFAVSNDKGVFTLPGSIPGKYMVKATAVNYKAAYSNAFDVAGTSIRLLPIQLKKTEQKLMDVVVTGKRAMVEVKADKTVVNVEGTINAIGSDVIELLRKSPGVMLDQNDNILLTGKSGVLVYIDGKPSPLTGEALAAYLRSIQSSQVDAIELITNPSARFDAAGDAGIINIKLKKSQGYGTNGSVTAGANYGTYPKYNAGTNLNHRNNDLNLFGNYNYNESANEILLDIDRTVRDTIFNVRSNRVVVNKNHNIKAGFDYAMNDFNTIGFIATANIVDIRRSLLSTTPISSAGSNKIDRWLVADNRDVDANNNLSLSFNYRKTNKNGLDWNTDAEYSLFRKTSDQLQPNIYYSGDYVSEIARRTFQFISPSNIDLGNIRTDIEKQAWHGKLNFGAKIALVQTDNDFTQFNLLTSERQYDSTRSNRFRYQENINAAFFNFSRQYKTWSYQVGLRAENTNILARSSGFKQVNSNYATFDSTFTRRYTGLFPTLSLSYNKDSKNQFGLAINRRINRPNYQDQNPFVSKIDEYTFRRGNTNLSPQYSWGITLSHAYKSTLNTRLSFTRTTDLSTELVDTIETVKSIRFPVNLGRQDVAGLNVSYNYQKRWYTLFASGGLYHRNVYSNLGVGRIIDNTIVNYDLKADNSFKLGKGYTLEANATYQSPTIFFGTFIIRERSWVDIAIQKTVLKSNGTIRLAYSDIFFGNYFQGSTDFGGQSTSFIYKFESRMFKINFTYRFGNTQVKAARQSKTSDDEKNRAGDANG